MAFTSNSSSISSIDDTVPLSCDFIGTETVNDHIEYNMRVQRGFDSKYSWKVKKRYNDFNDLYNQLKLFTSDLPLPPKKAFGNKSREFLSIRQVGLQEFMNSILNNLVLANSLPVKNFLDTENYSVNFKELALAHVSMFFRSESNWQVIEPLDDIGWRFRKKYILLKNTDIPNSKFILTWCEHGPDKYLKESEIKPIFLQFPQIQHEYIEPIVRISSGESSTIVIQRFNEKAVSLRDYIHGQLKINSNYLKKYARHKANQSVPVNLIKIISKKVLLALQFIYSKGLFYGHLHSGNVLIEPNGNSVRLTDIQNGLLGLPFFYRSYVIENRKIQNMELVDVYGFGHILYEMVYGRQLISSSSLNDFNDCNDPEIRSILEMILATDFLQKTGPPNINQLLELPFFKNTNVDILQTSSKTAAAATSSSTNNNNKLLSSTKTKEVLEKAREFSEKRMNEEQKFLSKFRRQNEAEAKILSEEEIRRRRKEKKKAEKETSNSLEYPNPLTSKSKEATTTTSNNNNLGTNNSSSSVSSSKNSDAESQRYSTLSTDSSSSATAPKLPPPPPPPPPPPSIQSANAPPPPPPPPISPKLNTPSAGTDRTQLLSSITSFSKNGLKKTKTNDRSAPKV